MLGNSRLATTLAPGAGLHGCHTHIHKPAQRYPIKSKTNLKAEKYLKKIAAGKKKMVRKKKRHGGGERKGVCGVTGMTLNKVCCPHT